MNTQARIDVDVIDVCINVWEKHKNKSREQPFLILNIIFHFLDGEICCGVYNQEK